MGGICPKKEQEVANVEHQPGQTKKRDEEAGTLKSHQPANREFEMEESGANSRAKGGSPTPAPTKQLVKSSPKSEEEEDRFQVVVIGCGPSGMAAADFLQSQGIRVKVVEARDRIGGRVNSSTFLGFTCDIGASFIHGHEGSKVYALAKKYNVPMIEFDFEDAFALFDGEHRNIQKMQKRFEEFEKLLDKASKKAEGSQSMRDLANLVAEENEIEGDDRLLFELFLSADIEAEYAITLNKLSAAEYGESDGMDGNDYIMPTGYIRIFEKVAENLDLDLSCPVKEIKQSEDEVQVICSNGRVLRADYVVCTLPLGILKSKTVQFNPPLSEEKTDAIESLGFGTLDKLIIEFEEVFWPDNLCFYLVNSEKEHFMFGVNIYKLAKIPALMLFISQSVKETLKDEKVIKEFALNLLRHNFPGDNIQVKKDYLTNWGSEIFTRGAYSSFAKGSDMSHVKAFTVPEGRLFFAGEHTYAPDMSTVNGAWNSGLIAAENIIKFISS